MYTVKQLADLAGVSVRTLHYYDEIQLLKPSQVGDNGYRYYSEANLLRLQQILLYRELGIGLLQIRDVLDAPDFDLVAALRAHRRELQARRARLEQLIETVDGTIMRLVGEVELGDDRLFDGFSEAQQARYTAEARQLYGAESVDASVRRWEAYGQEKQQHIQAEGAALYAALAQCLTAGLAPERDEVQALLARWHEHIRYFYEPTPEILRGLGHLYNQHPDFMATFQKVHPDLPPFLEAAVTVYCDRLDEALLAHWAQEAQTT
jgi:DNA-binding transcriptional MerR regulator